MADETEVADGIRDLSPEDYAKRISEIRESPQQSDESVEAYRFRRFEEIMGSKAAAFITYAFVAANLAAYKIALADADAAYYTSLNTANAALDEQVGNLGLGGLIDGARWTPLLTIA